jgi:hypothetical protein
MSASETIRLISEKIQQQLGINDVSDQLISDFLGVGLQSIRKWKRNNRTSLTPRQVTNLIVAVQKATERKFVAKSINTIVEFFQIDATDSARSARQEIFSTKLDNGNQHLYLAGLRNELQNHYGVYVFYDSRGRAIYVGKAVEQKLWGEIKSAFNRDRNEIQSIYRVKHPERNIAFKTSEEKYRQIKKHKVKIYEIAAYLSAYSAPIELIPKVEALMVRAFANDLLNIKMEKLAPRRRKSSS